MMNLDLSLRIIDAVCTLIHVKTEMDSYDLGDVIDIILESIVVAYHNNDQTALEEILDRAEKLKETI